MSRARRGRMGRRGSPGPREAFTSNLGTGAGIGAAAFVANYVLVYLFVIIDGVDSGDEMWKFVGNVLYNAQFVSTELSGSGQSVTINYVTGSSSNEFLSALVQGVEIGSTIPAFVYHLGPVVILAVAGVVAANQIGPRLDTQSAAAAGAAIVPGTLALSVLGVFLFEGSESSGSVAPELAMGVLLVGVVFPLILGAVGGAISNEL